MVFLMVNHNDKLLIHDSAFVKSMFCTVRDERDCWNFCGCGSKLLGGQPLPTTTAKKELKLC